jgi:hypothetical protein
VADEQVNGGLAVLRGCFWKAQTKPERSTKDSVFQFSNVSFILLCLSPSASSDAYFFVRSYVNLSKSTMNQIQFQTFPSESSVFAV